LAKQFQRRRLLEIGQSETRIVCGDHVCQRIRMKCAIFIVSEARTCVVLQLVRTLH
jgi:hypothetical protein